MAGVNSAAKWMNMRSMPAGILIDPTMCVYVYPFVSLLAYRNKPTQR